MNNNQSSPNSISHKELNSFLNKAKKDLTYAITSDNDEINSDKEFTDVITNWTKTSKKLLLLLNKKDQVPTKNRNPKSLMAYGAMGAHINLALQALKAAEFEQ